MYCLFSFCEFTKYLTIIKALNKGFNNKNVSTMYCKKKAIIR